MSQDKDNVVPVDGEPVGPTIHSQAREYHGDFSHLPQANSHKLQASSPVSSGQVAHGVTSHQSFPPVTAAQSHTPLTNAYAGVPGTSAGLQPATFAQSDAPATLAQEPDSPSLTGKSLAFAPKPVPFSVHGTFSTLPQASEPLYSSDPITAVSEALPESTPNKTETVPVDGVPVDGAPTVSAAEFPSADAPGQLMNVSQSMPSVGLTITALNEDSPQPTRTSADGPAQFVEAAVDDSDLMRAKWPIMSLFRRMPSTSLGDHFYGLGAPNETAPVRPRNSRQHSISWNNGRSTIVPTSDARGATSDEDNNVHVSGPEKEPALITRLDGLGQQEWDPSARPHRKYSQHERDTATQARDSVLQSSSRPDGDFFANLTAIEEELNTRFHVTATGPLDGKPRKKRARRDQDSSASGFPSLYFPQVPIPGWSPELKEPAVPRSEGQDPTMLLRETSESLGKPENSVEVRDELLKYAHLLYSNSVASGDRSSGAQAPDASLIPLLYVLHRRHRNHLPTILLLSCTYYACGNISASLWYNNLILFLDSNYVEAMSNIGTALCTLGHLREAEGWWWRALQLLPGYWDAFENLLRLLCTPIPAHNGAAEHPAQFSTALHLCEFVEAHIIPVRSEMNHADTSQRVQVGYSAGSMEPQMLPHHLPLTQLPRMQNLLYAKGNLKYVIGNGVDSAAQEYQRAIEIMLSSSNDGLFSVRDIVVAICTLAVLSFGTVIPGMNALSTAAEIAGVLGIDLTNPVHTWVVSQGMYMRLHPCGILGLVRDAGDAVVKKLLEVGGGQLPTIMLLPEQVALLRRLVFSHTNGAIPIFSSRAGIDGRLDPALESVAQQSLPISSKILLALSKLFQDAALSPRFDPQFTLQGIPPSMSLLFPLYYFALTLSTNAAMFNNLGILLSSLPAVTTTVGPNGERIQLSGQILAVHYYAVGLQLDPKHAQLYTNLGSLFKDMGRLGDAVKMYGKAVEFNPTFDVALTNLANTIKEQGRTQDSIVFYRRSVNANPNLPEAVGGLVNALLSVCDWSEVYPGAPKHGLMENVITVVRRQLANGMRYGQGTFRSQGSIDQWVSSILHVLGDNSDTERKRWHRRLAPFYQPESHSNEGSFVLRIIERLMRRTQYRWYCDKYKRGIVLPNEAYAMLPLPSCLPIPDIPTVLPFHTFTYPLSAREVRLISHRSAMRTSHGALSKMWFLKHVYPPPPPPNTKLNIGYVSSDFNNHPLAHLIQSVFGLHDMNRFNVFCYATTPTDNSPYRRKIESEAQHFLDVSGWSSLRIIEQTQRDQIHILVNLNGYTKGARNDVFAARPCPVQMQFMGFAGGMSSSWTDWLVADPVVCPPHTTSAYRWREEHNDDDSSAPGDLAADLDPSGPREDWVYSERIIYMPRTYFVNDHAQGFRHPAEEKCVPSNEELSVEDSWEREEIRRWNMRKRLFPTLPDDYVILADFNQLYKTDPSVFKIWLRILARVPKSVLWLLRFPAPGEGHLRRFALEWAGPDVESRIIFTDVTPKHVHIYRGRVADLFLDTTECNAHTTAADILWSGTPLLTWPKHIHKMCSRVAASIVHATSIGNQLETHSEQEYEDRAVELASNVSYSYFWRGPDGDKPVPAPEPSQTQLDSAELTSHVTEGAILESMLPPKGEFLYRRGHGELAELRRKLFVNRDVCPLFDTRAWTRALESGYEEAWRRWESGTDTEDTPEWRALASDAPEKRSSHIWLRE